MSDATSPLRLEEADRAGFLASHPEWTLDGETLHRRYVFADFSEAMGFVTRVALAAEVADHHPDIDIRWNTVTLALSTHEVGALTEKDTTLAARIDTFVEPPTG
jgi:4a-hydroxytetrahydrobiopterin dehydratase